MFTTLRIDGLSKLSRRLTHLSVAAVLLFGSLSSRLAAQQDDANTTAPRLIQKTEPEYTEEARDARIQGTVVLGVEIGTDGKAHNAQVKRSLDRGLDQKAVEAVLSWTFEPGTRDGKPVPVQATIEVNFRLK